MVFYMMTCLTCSDSNTLHLHCPLYLFHITVTKLLQIWWPRTISTYYLKVLEVRGPKSVLLSQSQGVCRAGWPRNSGGSFPCLFKPVEAAYSAWLKVPSSNHSSFLLLSSHLPLLTLISCLRSSYKEHLRLYQAYPDHTR